MELEGAVLPHSDGEGQPDVLLFSIDTLRADHLQHSPTLSSFAERSWAFDQARAPSPWTLPSIVAVLTGRWFHQPFGPEQSILPVRDGLASSLGLRARAVVSNPHLRPNRGLATGFEQFLVVDSDDLVIEQSLAWLAEDGGGLVLAHIMGPHMPYGEGPEGFHDLSGGREGKYPAEDLRRLYREGVRQRLEAVAPLLEAAEVVVVFSDHGEELFEHGGFEHGHALWEEVLQVPILLHGEGIEARPDERPARLIDIPPTLAGVLGKPAPPTWMGVDLGREDPGAAWAADLLYPSDHRWAVAQDGLKLLDTTAGGFLFRLPDEVATLAGDPERARLARTRRSGDLQRGVTTARPSWARSFALEGVATVDIDGHLEFNPESPAWLCGWMTRVSDYKLLLEVEHEHCVLQLGGAEENQPRILLRDEAGVVVYEGPVREGGEALAVWDEPGEDERLRALGYIDP